MSAYSVIQSLQLAQTDAFNSMPVTVFSHLGTSNYLRGLYLTPSQGNASMEKKNDYIDNKNQSYSSFFEDASREFPSDQHMAK